MADQTATVTQLKRVMQDFVDERQWQPFHTPKNLAMSIAIEAAELMEHFQWVDAEASRAVRDDPAARQAVQEELADIVCYVLSFANATGIDIDDAVRDKMVKNAQKYPVGRFLGRYK